MFRFILSLIVLLFFSFSVSSQATVHGQVKDQKTGDPLPFVKVKWHNSSMGASTDFDGNFSVPFKKDSILFRFNGYEDLSVFVPNSNDSLVVFLNQKGVLEFDEVTVRPDKELASTRLHKKIVAHKKYNSKEKLDFYEYELYTKTQFNMDNVSEKFQNSNFLKKLKTVQNYIDTSENGRKYLPIMLSENLSTVYYKKSPKSKIEIVKASKLTGVENLNVDQFLGDFYLDADPYKNSMNLFNKNFLSPIASNARDFYVFVLLDSTFIDNQWCYKLKFKPKTKGTPLFNGFMWVHDSTFAIKSIKMTMAEDVNVNYVQDLEIEQGYQRVNGKQWMLSNEVIRAKVKLFELKKKGGVHLVRSSSRRDMKINLERPNSFYNRPSSVVFQDSSKTRNEEFWSQARHDSLNGQEKGIETMVSEVKNTRFFKFLKSLAHAGATGHFITGPVEIGHIFNFFSINPIEKFRLGASLRTSKHFSKIVRISGRTAYGFGDKKWKYAFGLEFNLSKRKRSFLELKYTHDLQQIGTAPSETTVGSTFKTLLANGPLDKLTFVDKAEIKWEYDVWKDFILNLGGAHKQFRPLGNVLYTRKDGQTGKDIVIDKIRTSEISFKLSWQKKRQFIQGVFNRRALKTKAPELYVSGVIGIEGLVKGEYNYQKFEIGITQRAKIGVLGRLFYGVSSGVTLGSAPYPFLHVHSGNQSFWMQLDAYNKMQFYEFVSDKYVNSFLEWHMDGLFFDRIPGVRKLGLRLVSSVRMAYGSMSKRHLRHMQMSKFTKKFGKTPYVEVGLGVENIFKMFRVDVVWRLTHNNPNYKIGSIKNFGVRIRYAINF